MDTGGSSVPREPGPRSAFQLDPAPHARTSHHTVPRGLRRLTTRDSDGVGRAGKGPATRGTSANIQQSHDNAQPPAKKGNRRPPPDRRPIEPGRRRDSVRPDSRLKLAPTGFAPLQLPRAYQRRKYLGPMDGYKPHKILIWIIFLCQRNKASSSYHRCQCRVRSPRIKLFLPYASFHSLRPEPALSDPRFTDQR